MASSRARAASLSPARFARTYATRTARNPSKVVPPFPGAIIVRRDLHVRLGHAVSRLRVVRFDIDLVSFRQHESL